MSRLEKIDAVLREKESRGEIEILSYPMEELVLSMEVAVSRYRPELSSRGLLSVMQYDVAPSGPDYSPSVKEFIEKTNASTKGLFSGLAGIYEAFGLEFSEIPCVKFGYFKATEPVIYALRRMATPTSDEMDDIRELLKSLKGSSGEEQRSPEYIRNILVRLYPDAAIGKAALEIGYESEMLREAKKRNMLSESAILAEPFRDYLRERSSK